MSHRTWRSVRITLRYTLQSMSVAVLIQPVVARAQEWPFRWLNLSFVAYLGISCTTWLC